MTSRTLFDLQNSLTLPSQLDEVYLKESNQAILIKRDDQIHPIICGNKWRKLEGHLKNYSDSGKKRILSMGGVHSNHLHALAYVCNSLNISCDLLIYGWHDGSLSPTLEDALRWSANLHPLARRDAQQVRDQNYECIQDKLHAAYWIPEGGGGDAGMIGIKNLVDELPSDFDQATHLIVCPCGSGTTLNGLIKYTSNIKIVSLKNVIQDTYPMLHNERFSWLPAIENKSFGKITERTLHFLKEFNSRYGIELDLIYTAPLMQAFIYSNLGAEYHQIYFIHTGGMQGNRIHL